MHTRRRRPPPCGGGVVGLTNLIVVSAIVTRVAARSITFCRDGVLDASRRTCCAATRVRDGRCVAHRSSLPECRSVGAVDCAVPNRTITRDERISFQRQCGAASSAAAQRHTLCVAVLLTGHMRTFARTAPALERWLAEPNDGVDLDLVVATYANQDAASPRFRDKTTHSTSAGAAVSSRTILDAYERVARWRAVVVHVYDEAEIGAVLPRDLRRQSTHVAKMKNDEHVAQVNRIKRTLALVQQGILMVQDLAERRRRRHDLVVRLRPDIELLAPVDLREVLGVVVTTGGVEKTPTTTPPPPRGSVVRNALVVPTTYDPRGGLGIRASQLATRPCARNGSLVPTWVQDHLALADLDAMSVYARFYHAYLKPHIFSAHVETSLAKYLDSAHLRVACLASIKYTVRR